MRSSYQEAEAPEHERDENHRRDGLAGLHDTVVRHIAQSA
jgi:hypothetical protein